MFSKFIMYLISTQQKLTNGIRWVYKTTYSFKKIFYIISGITIGISMLLSIKSNTVNLVLVNILYLLSIICLLYGFIVLLNRAITSVRYNLFTIFIIAGGVDYFVNALGFKVEWIWLYGIVCILLTLLVDCDVAKVSNRILLTVFSIVTFLLNKLYITDNTMVFTREQLERYKELGVEGLNQFEALLINNPEIFNNTIKNLLISEALSFIAPIVLIWVITRMLIESKEYVIKKYTNKSNKQVQ